MNETDRRRVDDARLDRIEADIGRLARGMALVHREQRAFFAADVERAKTVPPWITSRLNLRDLVWALVVVGAIWRGDTAGLIGFLTGRASAPAVVTNPVETPEPNP